MQVEVITATESQARVLTIAGDIIGLAVQAITADTAPPHVWDDMPSGIDLPAYLDDMTCSVLSGLCDIVKAWAALADVNLSEQDLSWVAAAHNVTADPDQLIALATALGESTSAAGLGFEVAVATAAVYSAELGQALPPSITDELQALQRAHPKSAAIQSLTSGQADTVSSGVVTYLVTGANGYIGTHVVAQLLSTGAHVRGTVRDVSDAAKVAHLQSLPGAADRLELVQADLLDAASFGPAVAGCRGVFHCASPFFIRGVADAQAQLMDPAVRGTQAVLAAAAGCASVQRVVLTSSTAAVYVDRRACDHFYTEDDWSDPDVLESAPYAKSKTLAEQAAWAAIGPLMQAAAAGGEVPAELPGLGVAPANPQLDLVVINPTLVLGPMLSPHLNTSCEDIALYMSGTLPVPHATKCLVDVRDVAALHVAAMLNPDATGRVLAISSCVPWRAVMLWARSALPARVAQALPAVKFEAADKPALPQGLFSQAQAWRLGVAFRPIEESVADTAMSLYLQGHLDQYLPADLAHDSAYGRSLRVVST